MRKIEPFENVFDALAVLDNGGRFYNFLTHAEDGLISTAEVSKVAGLFVGKKQVVLFLQMALSKLSAQDLETVRSKFDDSLKECYHTYLSRYLTIQELDENIAIGSQILLKGKAVPAGAQSSLTGFVFMMAAGSMVPVPVMEAYDVYSFTDSSNAVIPIVHPKDKGPFPDNLITVGGVLKELKSEKRDEKGKRYIEVCYYVSH